MQIVLKCKRNFDITKFGVFVVECHLDRSHAYLPSEYWDVELIPEKTDELPTQQTVVKRLKDWMETDIRRGAVQKVQGGYSGYRRE